MLWPDEELLVVGATARRRAQFAAGRDAARQAMAVLGVPAVGIGQGAEGEPLFPAELRGSISHTREHAVALVGLAVDYCSLGVDLDDARPLGDAAAAGVTWMSEVSRVQRAMGLADHAAAQNFAFSAKEAIFKCQYPLTLNSKLGHLQARLLAGQSDAGVMSVAGWRVAALTAAVLKRVVVRRLALGASPLAFAIIAAQSPP
ncbi:4'-phosphopantetheinyl transferase family protein [Variovorax sp. AFSI2.2]|uniref:4'-phosphopantetheinyl transferase family protein n=1 Tax=Variovorax sp. AFSI2.2 TaxID=3384160 RepID=UPI003EB6C0BD